MFWKWMKKKEVKENNEKELFEEELEAVETEPEEADEAVGVIEEVIAESEPELEDLTHDEANTELIDVEAAETPAPEVTVQPLDEPETVEDLSRVEEQYSEEADYIEVTVAPQAEQAADEVVEKKGFLKSLFSGLGKTRKKIGDQIDNLINNYSKIDDELYDELEEILISADVGMTSTLAIIEKLKEELVVRKVKNPSEVKLVLRDVMAEFLKLDDGKFNLESPTVLLVIGVNGAGKTTTIGKLASRLKKQGRSVTVAAADTFRAAAIDQLRVWAERAGVNFIAQSEGSDPSAVIFDALQSAKSKKTDVLICDTAGRLHNKVNLMNELNKMFRVIEREYPEAKKEVLLVLDATTGQNAINQAKQFSEAAGITALAVTKLDGTAKGGFVFSIASELGIPVRLIGVGEKIEDLQDFDALSFANAILNME